MLAIDIDGTIADTHTNMRAYIAREFDLDEAATPENDTYHNQEKEWPAEHRDAIRQLIWRGYQFNEGNVYGDATPLPGAADTLARLHERSLLGAYVTHRPQRIHEVTLAWLAQHGFPILPIIYDSTPDKFRALADMRATAVIEDNPQVAYVAATNGLHAVLIDASYNRRVMHERLYRVPDWDEASAMLDVIFGMEPQPHA